MADEHDRDPFALGELHEPQRRLSDLADTPGCAVQLVDHRGLDRVDDEHRRARRPCHLDDPGDITLGQDLDGGTRRSVEKAEALGPEANLGGRLLARGVQDGTAEPGGRLEQERGLADPRLAAEKDQRPGTTPPPRTRSSSPMDVGSRGTAASPMSRRGSGSVTPPTPTRARADAALDALALTTVSTRLFHSPQARHWPSHRRKASPQL